MLTLSICHTDTHTHTFVSAWFKKDFENLHFKFLYLPAWSVHSDTVL